MSTLVLHMSKFKKDAVRGIQSHNRRERESHSNPDIDYSRSAGNYDLHLALHSNASPENLSGMLMGPDVYYYAYSEAGEAAADIFADNLKAIYPNPNLVTVIPNTTLAELRRRGQRLFSSKSAITTTLRTLPGLLKI